ncbi:MAG: CHC2 zinc finger domain-containing protein, partial [Rickettsiales bacterium]
MRQVADRIRNALPASQVIGRKVSLKQKSNQAFVGLCPFHAEKTPSFTVNNEKQFYHCFGCGVTGDIFKFTMENEGLSFKEALEQLANEAGIELPKYTPKQIDEEKRITGIYEIFQTATDYYHKSLYEKVGKHALDYLKHRGLSQELIKEYQLGYASDNQNELATLLRKKFSDREIVESTVMMEGKGLYNMF